MDAADFVELEEEAEEARIEGKPRRRERAPAKLKSCLSTRARPLLAICSASVRRYYTSALQASEGEDALAIQPQKSESFSVVSLTLRDACAAGQTTKQATIADEGEHTSAA